MRIPFDTSHEVDILKNYSLAKAFPLAPDAEEKLEAAARAAIGRYVLKELSRNFVLGTGIIVASYLVARSLD